MNQQQKSAVHELREIGQSYTQIANMLGISENTVQSYCRRKKLGGVASSASQSINVKFCRNCGKPLKQTQGKKTKKYCSDKCRMAWWNTHPDAVKHKIIRVEVCQSCGKSFEVHGNRERKYCSRGCYGKSKMVQHDQ